MAFFTRGQLTALLVAVIVALVVQLFWADIARSIEPERLIGNWRGSTRQSGAGIGKNAACITARYAPARRPGEYNIYRSEIAAAPIEKAAEGFGPARFEAPGPQRGTPSLVGGAAPRLGAIGDDDAVPLFGNAPRPRFAWAKKIAS